MSAAPGERVSVDYIGSDGPHTVVGTVHDGRYPHLYLTIEDECPRPHTLRIPLDRVRSIVPA